MIDSNYAEHFSGDNGLDCAKRKIIAKFPTGETKEIIIRLGHPFVKDQDSESRAVRVELDGLEAVMRPIMGIDGFQAIAEGIAFIVARLEDYVEKGICSFFWPDSDEPFDPKTLALRLHKQQV